MDTIIPWFIKANIAFVALYLFYRIFLHRDTFFREKRFAFILSYLFALLYPLINMAFWIQNNESAKTIAQTLSNTLPEITVTPVQQEQLSTEKVALIAYFLIAGILLIRILWQIASVLLLTARCPAKNINGQKIIQLPNGLAPFSFFGWIFLNPDEHSSRDMEEIIHHEKTHAHQLHTLDVLFSEIICTLFWINPFVWLLKCHLRENLEYLADKNVLHSGFDPKSYQYHLLRLSYQQSANKLGNNFNVSQLKNRIVMMNKKKTSLAGLSKYALSLPLFALLFLSAYAWGVKQNVVTTESVLASVKPAENPVSTTPNSEIPIVSKKDTVKTVATDEKKNTSETDEVKNTSEVVVVGYAPEKIDSTDMPLEYVEQMPQYPGGEMALMKLITDNLKYPASAAKMGIEGRVIIRFVVNKTGDVSSVEVVRGIDPSCDNEAMRVVKLMPRWIPGMDKGENVSVYYTLPISYRLSK